MKVKVSDYIAEFMAAHGVVQVFTVVGGGAMHLNDSLGHHSSLHCIYNHHEQACAMAAEGYAKVTGCPALVCVTSGPGAINALNGVAGAYQDSIPMLILSGQTKTTLMKRNSGLRLRTLGNQEFDIVPALGDMTKYAETVMDAMHIAYCLEKAYSLAVTGRPGPCWLDIPLDIQGAYIETEELKHFRMSEEKVLSDFSDSYDPKEILGRIQKAKRPVLYAGNGIRLAGGVEMLQKLSVKLDMPVVTCWDSIDLMPTDDTHYCGRAGIMGDRGGNFAVQNSDLLLAVGTRLNIYQVGYNVETWAREAYVIAVDIDSEELKKKTVRIDRPICSDACQFMNHLLLASENSVQFVHKDWVDQCNRWKKKYPVCSEEKREADGLINIYAFMDILSKSLKEDDITVVTNGSASVVGSAAYFIREKSRFIMNCGMSSMGYGLPASIGASAAVPDKDRIICIEGDGSIMMNLQELQTVVTNQLQIIVFVINNNGYHQIRQTQNNIFHNGLIGVGPESNDLGFPDFKKLADAFGLGYYRMDSNKSLQKDIENVMAEKVPLLCEVIVDAQQQFEPKSATKRLEDGSLFSPPLEDLAPFLPRKELEENMYIPLVE